MTTKNNGLLLMALAIILAIIAFFATSLLVWLFWIAVIVIFAYGLYMFLQKKPS